MGKILNTIIDKNLDSRKVLELLKLKIDITFIFQIDGDIDSSKTIKVSERIHKNIENYCVYTIGKDRNLYQSTYPDFFKILDNLTKQGYSFTITADKKDINIFKNVLKYLGKMNQTLISNVTFIDYNKKYKYMEIRNRPLKTGISDVIYYFENDNSILMFNEQGPNLYLPEGINSISDILT